MSKYLTPDIYFEKVVRDERYRPLEISKMNICAFIGVAERGPIQHPTRITTWQAFKQIFSIRTRD